MAQTRKPKRIGSENQYRNLAKTVHVSKGKRRKRKGSHNTKQYQDTRNARAKAQRRLANMEKELGTLTGVREKAALERRMNELRAAIESTRTYSAETGKRIRTKEEVAANLQKLEFLNRASQDFLKGTAGAQARKNKFTQNQINLASKKDSEGSVYTRAQVTVFYRFTQDAWINTDLTNINQSILDYYGKTAGSDDLATIFEWVMQQGKNADIVKALEILENENASDDDRNWAFDILKNEGLESYASGTGSINQDNPLAQ